MREEHANARCRKVSGYASELEYFAAETHLAVVPCVIFSSHLSGLPRCKNLTRFSLFVSFCFAVRYCLKCLVSFVLCHP